MRKRTVGRTAPRSGVEALRRLLRLYRRKGWCRVQMARDSRHRGVNYYSPRAVEFCLLGGLHRVVYGIEPRISRGAQELEVVGRALRRMTRVVGEDSIMWNDHVAHTKRQVMAAIRRAAEL